MPAGREVVVIPKGTTVKVKDWVASGETPFEAVMVIGKVPDSVGVPERTPPVKVTPEGRAPVSVRAGVG